MTPRMAGVVDRMMRARLPPYHTMTPQQARQAYEKGAGVLEVPKPVVQRVEDIAIPARDGTSLGARLYAASSTAQALPALLFFHGAGFTVGSVQTHDTLCRVLAAQSGCAVVSLDYRLAPEHRFPTAVEDSWDALAWLAQHGSAFGIDGARLAVGGDSAGGTLAAVSAIHARDLGLPLALQLLFYPGMTGRQETASHRLMHDAPVLSQDLIRYFFDQYIDESERDDWRFAPLHADDVEGVAPLWIGLAEVDPTIDEGIAYADKLRAAGVPVTLEIYRGVIHEFVKMGRAIPEALTAQADAARALREAFGLQDNATTAAA